jgi:hypothetical protein
MPANITDVQSVSTELVLQERVTTNEFTIVEIQESIRNRVVRVDVELGPFVTTTRPTGQTETRGSGRKTVVAWENEEYDTVRDTWTNVDLMAVITAKLEV